MDINFTIGLDVISSYKRLAYTPWYAIAEFIDNATQAYFDSKDVLDNKYLESGEEGLFISITYDKNQENGFIRISDNSIGMSFDDLSRAMHVAQRPPNPTGRSKYGMGLKTAACWIGNYWTVRTKKLGESTEHQVTIDVNKIAKGDNGLDYRPLNNRPIDDHYTIIEITDHNREFHGRTLGKIRNYLRSMYRDDFRNGYLILEWQGERLSWQEPEMLESVDGSLYKKDFAFEIGGKFCRGWVGILRHGSRADAGFSILNSGRVIKGWPEAWRPSSLYGQIQGSNDLINQRLVGEIHLDSFDVSHTKDDILWLGNQEEEIERLLLVHCGDYREKAKIYRKRSEDARGPSEVEVQVALDEVRNELQSPEKVDKIELVYVPPAEVISQAKEKLVEDVTEKRIETFRASIGSLLVKVFIASELSINDPYVLAESTKDSEIIVIVNSSHPHWNQLKASEGVANYLRHCVYDAIAEWQARKRVSRIDPDTIKTLKDQLLRVSFEMERHLENKSPDI
jgi:hypothetical protein